MAWADTEVSKAKCPRLSPRAFGLRRLSTALEIQLRAQLKNARVAEGGYRSEPGADRSAGGAQRLAAYGAADAQISEVGMVENVECFGAKLQLDAFAKTNVLHYREVDALGWWSIDGSARSVPHRIA